ncbi:MAG: DUF1566 domain-containing protein [Myxococcales bacterium]|nr:DUF1566 domain-containing protein [Myxococcales bacterium]
MFSARLVGLVVAAAVLAPTAPALAAPVLQLSRSGQTSCYDESGSAISCSGTGQDGDSKAGVSWPSPRFTDNGDGTLLDKLTGLTWLRDAACLKTHYPAVDQDTFQGDPAGIGDGNITWQHCLDFVAGVNGGTYPSCAAGKSDWRMANVNELETLSYVESSGSSWLEAQGFTNVIGSGYWSSTTHRIFLPYNGWFVDLNTGAVSNTDKTDVGGCLLVRGGQSGASADPTYPANVFVTGQGASYAVGDDGDTNAGVSWPSPRFADNSDGTVTDQLTGLSWLKDANCMRTQYSASDSDGRVSWQQALDFVAGINDGTYASCGAGKSDWRLPNRRELHSLTDHGAQTAGALPSGHPFDNVDVGSSPGYWSSTTYTSLPSWAWFWNPKYGDVSGAPKNGTRTVWPVRGTVTPTVEPDIAVSPTALSFGEVTTGSASAIEVLSISNGGASKLDVRSIVTSSPVIFVLSTDNTNNNCGSTVFSLQPGASCTVGVQFKPNAVRTFSETLTITSSDPDTPALVVTLGGSGIDYPKGAPRCNITPSSHDFGDLPINQRSALQIFKVANIGEGLLTVTAVNDQQAEEFDYDLGAGDYPCGSLPFTVQANAYCTFGIAFAPKNVGPREGWIHVHSDDPMHASIQLTLTGTGTPDESSGGCGCAVDDAPGHVLGGVLLLSLGLLLLVRRRRRR